jgi:hypothetical protein
VVGLQSCNCQALMKLSCYHSSITKQSMFIMLEYVDIISFLFWIRGNPTFLKAHFVGSGERVKPRLFQALIRNARLDSNSRPAIQISSSLPLHYGDNFFEVSRMPIIHLCMRNFLYLWRPTWSRWIGYIYMLSFGDHFFNLKKIHFRQNYWTTVN